jgi:hypothetical protein
MMREKLRGAVITTSALALGLALGATQLSAQAQSPAVGSYALLAPVSGVSYDVANSDCAWPGGPLDDEPYAMLYANGAPLRGYGEIDRAAARILKENWHAAGEPAGFDPSPYLSPTPPQWVCDQVARQGLNQAVNSSNLNQTFNETNDNGSNDNGHHSRNKKN